MLRTADGAEMVLVPAGPFLRGGHEGVPEASPPHQLDLPAFYVDRTEVTVEQYARFLAATGQPAPPGWQGTQPPTGTEKRPITNLTWAEAMRYALWTGKRLPTEAEWEKAARGADGRRYPWGNADRDTARNKDSGKLRPVGMFPEGASPYGCLDLSGNAWEWTADWFQPYPGTAARSVHFGKHYKVIRGGAGEYLYATSNTGTTTQRARLVPYGRHDFVGFRCVKDPPGRSSPYDPEERLRETEALLETSLRPARPLAHEQEFAGMAGPGAIPVHLTGAEGQRELVVAGFPLPRGRIRDARAVAVFDSRNHALPLSVAPLAHWPDGSIRWLLLRFPGGSAQTVRVQLAQEAIPPTAQPDSPVRLSTNGTTVELDTGPLNLRLNRDQWLHDLRVNGQSVCQRLRLQLTTLTPDGPLTFQLGTADQVAVESQSPLHADLRLRGVLVTSEAAPGPWAYDLRVRATAGSTRVRLWLTLLHAQARRPPWEALMPQAMVKECWLHLDLPEPPSHWILGTEHEPLAITNRAAIGLRQPDDLQYTLTAGGETIHQGPRAPGWFSAATANQWFTIGVRHFWQNHPAALAAAGKTLSLGWWAGAEPFLWEGGLAKTREFVLDCASEAPVRFPVTPLRAVVPPAWSCGTAAAGDLLPRNAEALQHLAYWECWREDSMRQWVNAMPTGVRDFGDAYMGGPYKGTNAYANLEYDVPLNFLHQFLRTGNVWYFDAAETMVRHQADVDTENVAGFAWKHSPLHTTTQAEFGHVFIRGLLLHHLLTGDPRDREIAMRLGDWVAESLRRGQGVGNERQIGWSLHALTGLSAVVPEPRYREAALALCRRLAREQAPTGRFNIRWDNRIAFFNGIAMNGMIGVQELWPDPDLAQAIHRVAYRTLGMYPEYAGRTLNAFAWMVEQAPDARFLHNLERTWQSTLEFLLDRESVTAETHAWRFPGFALRHELLPALAATPAQLPRANTWQSLRLRQPVAAVYLRARSGDAVPVLLVREGLAQGDAVLVNAQGTGKESLPFDGLTNLVQARPLTVPANRPWSRLRLSSREAFAWQVHHDERVAVTIADPKGALLPSLLPRAIGFCSADAREVVIRLEAMGEGFHSATLFTPGGAPVSRVQRFIDFADPGRYVLELRAPVAGPRRGWALELNAVRVVSIEGMAPYWAASQDDLFHPEQDQISAND